MIIEKTYNFNDVSKEYIGYLTLRDYHKTILTDIIKQCNEFLLKGYMNHVIIVGIEGTLTAFPVAVFFFFGICLRRRTARLYLTIF